MQQVSVAPIPEVPSASDEVINHLPSAYLASWAVRGTLCAMHKAENDLVVESVSPDEACRAPGRRGNDDLPAELAQLVEQQLAVLAPADAAAALQPIVQGRPAEWDAACRDSFARFIASLVLRHPLVVTQAGAAMRDIVATGTRELKTRYAALRSDPRTFAEYVTRSDTEAPTLAAIGYLQKVMDGDALAATINRMHWSRITVSDARFTLLTSDQPLDIPLSLADKNAYIALPLSPASLFLASNNP